MRHALYRIDYNHVKGESPQQFALVEGVDLVFVSDSAWLVAAEKAVNLGRARSGAGNVRSAGLAIEYHTGLQRDRSVLAVLVGLLRPVAQTDRNGRNGVFSVQIV